MRTLVWVSLSLIATMHAAEPRYQLRSLIQNDGTLLHVRLDTQTGKTWRLQRTLENRLATTIRGKLSAQALERSKITVGNLNSFTLEEVVEVLNKAISETGNKKLPKFTFAIPVKEPTVDPAKANTQLVPPSRPSGGAPQVIDPNTGLPNVHNGSETSQTPLPPPGALAGSDRRPIDPNTGEPIWVGPIGAAIDPVTGLPLTPIPRWQPPQRKDRVELFRIRNWPNKKTHTAHNLIIQILNTCDSPLRCIIDEHFVYLTPEASLINVSGGDISRPIYNEKWVEIIDNKPE